MVPILPCGTIRVPSLMFRSTSGQLYVLDFQAPSIGDLVACPGPRDRPVVERYRGQACLGVLRSFTSVELGEGICLERPPGARYNPT